MYDIHYIYISLLSSFGFLAIDYYFPPQKNSNINYISLLNAVVTGIPSMLILRQDNIIEYLPYETDIWYFMNKEKFSILSFVHYIFGW